VSTPTTPARITHPTTPNTAQAPAAVAGVDKQQLIADVRAALYCSKVNGN
jgi:hypothetical protein